MKEESLVYKKYFADENNMINQIKEQKEERLFILKNADCVAYKMNIRTLKNINPLLSKNNTWLTIGDYTGFEAKYLIEHNQTAIPSNISDVFLKEVHKEGLIGNYKKINAEDINLDENSFDYVSCRETLHHFPRPYLGLYEMIRVAKKGVVLIDEPIDILSKMPLFLFIKNICDLFNPHLINKIWRNRFSWEKVGNYVFKISEREIEKIAMGMGLPCIAFKRINIKSYSIIKNQEKSRKVPTDYKLLKKLNRELSFWNFICKLRILPYNSLCAIIFKSTPDNVLLQVLRKKGYKVVELPKNPYID